MPQFHVTLERRYRGATIGSTLDTIEAPDAAQAELTAINAWMATLPSDSRGLTFAPLLTIQVPDTTPFG